MPSKRDPGAPYWIALEHAEREIIRGALRATGGSVTRSARALGIDRTHLTKRMSQLGMNRKAIVAELTPAPEGATS